MSSQSEKANKENEPGSLDPVAPPTTVSHMLGEIVWVLAQSPTHKHFSLADLEWLVVPPLMLEQYYVFRDEKNAPIGVALWAYLNDAAEKQFDSGATRLRPDQWKSGDRLWLVELVAPFATVENLQREKMMGSLIEGKLMGKEMKFHTYDNATKKKSVQKIPRSN